MHGERHRSVSSGPEDENLSGAEEHDPVGGSFQRGSWYGHGASGAIASASVLEQVGKVTDTRHRYIFDMFV